MPRTIFAALLTLLCCAGAHAQGTSTPITINVGYYEFPPYSWTGPDGTPQGSILRLTERLLRHAGYRGTFRAYPGARLYAGLRDGSVQLWPGAGGKPELEGHTLEARNSIGAINLSLFYRRDTAPPQLPQGLAGRGVILISGYSYWKPVTDWLGDPTLGLTTHRTSTHEAALEMLQRHRGDFLIDYQSPVEQARQTLGFEPLHSTLLHRLQLRLVASRHAAGSSLLLQKLDQAYEELQAAGVDLSIE